MDPKNAYAKDSAISRLNELAFHENSQVAKHAMATVAVMNQSEQTQKMLETHLSASSDELKISALNGLYYFQSPDHSLLTKVRNMAEDRSTSARVRSLAEDLVKSLEEIAELKRSQDLSP